MLTRRLLLASATAAALAFASPALAQDRLKVVATFSILADLVAQVGGDRVELVTLVGPDGDAHVYQPSPADAQAVTDAALIVANGLGFEGWMDRLVEASGTSATIVTATEGVTPIALDEAAKEDGHDHDHAHDHGAEDPHAWQSVTNVAVYVENIAKGLSAADPEGAAVYQANATAYLEQLSALEADIKAAVAALPVDRRTIVTSHDSFAYFAAAYGLTFVSPQGVSTEAEASARDVAALITQIRDSGINAVFVENIADPRLLDQIANETGAKIGGTLFSDALSGPDGQGPTYIAMMRHNLKQLTAALGS
jgi:zinc/manganese transport system substrate-binding protein